MDKIFKSETILDTLKIKGDAEDTKVIKTERFIIFMLSDKYYAITSDSIKEVNNIEKIFFFPHVDSWLKGLVNIRGDVHSILDLKKVLSIESQDDEDMSLLYSSNAITTAVAIDNIIDVLDVNVEDIIPSQDSDSKYISGMLHFKENRAVIIAMTKIINDLLERLSE